MKQIEVVKRAILGLEAFEASRHVLAGFDGFVDEIIHVVDKRISPQEFKRIKDISGFANRIASGAALSANIELVPTNMKLGGHGPIMANALLSMGCEVSYIGALGRYYIHPVFREFAEKCKQVISIAEPGHTDALEFLDGKIMLNKTSSLVDVNIEKLNKKLPEQTLLGMIESSHLVALTNLTMLSNMNGIIESFSQLIRKIKKKPLVYVDLGDPKKRTDEDVRNILKLISDIPGESILSMNLGESTIVSLILGIKEDEICSRAEQIKQKLGVSAVVIHPVNGAAIAHGNESMWVKGPYTKNPALTTGGGNNFNAGFCIGWLAGLEPEQCLALGVFASGYYVRNGHSPSRENLLGFMKKWRDEE